jgi:hypothetical protein
VYLLELDFYLDFHLWLGLIFMITVSPCDRVVVLVVVISFTLTSRLRRYAGYHNYDHPYLTTLLFHYIQTKLVPRRGLCYSVWLASCVRVLTGTRL